MVAICLTAFFTMGVSQCATTGTAISGAVTSATAWLSDPKNIQEVEAIAQTAISLAGMFGRTSHSAIVDRLAKRYPDVPVGALEQIAANPSAYARTR